MPGTVLKTEDSNNLPSKNLQATVSMGLQTFENIVHMRVRCIVLLIQSSELLMLMHFHQSNYHL